MSGPIEADELYVGNRDKNKHADKRGGVKKMAVAEIRDRKTGRVATTPVPEATASRMEYLLGCHVEPGSVVCTDESRMCFCLKKYHTITHGAGEYVQRPYKSTIESFWALLKLRYHGTYHGSAPPAPEPIRKRVCRPAQRVLQGCRRHDGRIGRAHGGKEAYARPPRGRVRFGSKRSWSGGPECWRRSQISRGAKEPLRRGRMVSYFNLGNALDHVIRA